MSWHGFLSFVGVAAAIYLAARWARREQIDPDMVYNVAIWGIIGGVIGARVVHVADNWGVYSGNIGSMFQIWSGGIGLWGGILGGWLAGGAYAYVAKYPLGRLMDVIAPAMLIGQSIGRIGDIINGEHWARGNRFALGLVFHARGQPCEERDEKLSRYWPGNAGAPCDCLRNDLEYGRARGAVYASGKAQTCR